MPVEPTRRGSKANITIVITANILTAQYSGNSLTAIAVSLPLHTPTHYTLSILNFASQLCSSPGPLPCLCCPIHHSFIHSFNHPSSVGSSSPLINNKTSSLLFCSGRDCPLSKLDDQYRSRFLICVHFYLCIITESCCIGPKS